MYILALDQSTSCLGYVILSKEGKIITSGSFTPEGDLNIRIHKVKLFIKDLIKQYKITYVFLEDIQYQKNQKTYKILAYLLGVLINLFTEQEIEFEIIPPTTWKSWNGIKGRKREEQKRNTKEKVKEIFSVEAGEDEADAIMIGRYGLNKLLIKNIWLDEASQISKTNLTYLSEKLKDINNK